MWFSIAQGSWPDYRPSASKDSLFEIILMGFVKKSPELSVMLKDTFSMSCEQQSLKAHQPAHLHSLVRDFVIILLKSITLNLAASEISLF